MASVVVSTFLMFASTTFNGTYTDKFEFEIRIVDHDHSLKLNYYLVLLQSLKPKPTTPALKRLHFYFSVESG